MDLEGCELRRVRLGPEDRVLVSVPAQAWGVADGIVETVARWLGIDRERVLVTFGDVRVEVVAPEEGA